MTKTLFNPGLYVHIPFCRSKCPYCAFYSIASATLIPRWLKAFREEIKHYKGHFDEFDSLYLGGGTPSFLDIKDLAGMMEHLFTHFDFARDTEITLEANPCDLNREKIESLVQTHDIFPTLLEVLEVKSIDVWKQCQAVSLFNALKGQEREYALAEYQKPLLAFERMLNIDPDYDFRKWYKSIKALIVGEYKYIWYSTGEEELYNLKEDPLEQNNLADIETGKVEEMRKKLYSILFSLDQRDLGDLVQGSEDNIRKLEKLGYIRRLKPYEKEPVMKGMSP